MTVEMPDPVPLDMPPGEPAAVDDLVRDVTGAAYWLAVLADQLSGPAASAPAWLGADAVAAATQLARVAAITRGSADAVRATAGRLSTHGALLRDTRREVTALREEQDEDFRVAWQRLGQSEDLRLAVLTGSSAWVGVVAELEAAESRRRRRHALVLEELADDAAATVRELADAGRLVGATGRTGDGGRVLAYLAAELPGWGHPELAGRGRALADAMMGESLTPEERAALASDSASLAGNPVFATALVRGLGEVGVGLLLQLLGQDPDGPDNPLAGVLASALGAATPGPSAHDGVAAVLGATYVRADERIGAAATAAGMAAVLLAGAGSAGLRPATAGEWARQLLVREHVQKMPAGTVPVAWPSEAADPVAVAVQFVARSGDPEAAAALLGDERVWEALLVRFWGDGGTALGDLVAEAGRESGPAGDRAVRLGLETIGAGLVEGDPADWTVDRDVVAAVSPALGDAVAAHVDLAANALGAVASDDGASDGVASDGVASGGGGGEASGDLLKGLGYLTVDRQAAAAVEGALSEWAGMQSHDLAGSSRAHPLPAVAVPAAYLAVQEYGQRLNHALDGFELQEEAENKERLWNWTAGWVLEVVSYVPVKPVAVAADVLGAYGPLFLDMDGTFEQLPDRGLRHDADMAGANALAALPPDLTARADAVRAQAEASYRRTAGWLGDPVAPTSPEKDWVGATLDLLTGGMADMGIDELRDRAEREGAHGRFGGLLPGRR
ncbi:hypothetical protein FHU33_0674 [Blastococcus colisei]|uniref:Uncharacterized protein n=1 Tax=Blastococcus colisei TaxID=1564162 RepID=A0A543PBC6_9ACTN|nr:hypothetical protein [Blastococcus colisei]TQN41310.1 hypothetical protein FHU33_0674 [Blastococcus colisei]